MDAKGEQGDTRENQSITGFTLLKITSQSKISADIAVSGVSFITARNQTSEGKDMTESECDTFLRQIRIGTLCTLNKDGSPNAVPLWYEWDGKKIRLFSSRDTGKVRRLTNDPRACFSVEDPVGVPESWVTVEGTIKILEQGGKELAVRLAKIYYEGDQRAQTVAKWSKKNDWVLLELTPSRIRSMDQQHASPKVIRPE